MKSLNLQNSDFSQLTEHFDDEKCPDAKANRLHAAKISFKWFMLLYMGHKLTYNPADFQFWSYEQAFCDRLLLIWFRRSGKSITWSVGYPLWAVLNNPFNLDQRYFHEIIAQVSHAGDLPEQWIDFQKKELTENERILADYNPKEGKHWRADRIDVLSDIGKGTIYSKGSGAQIRGHHPTEVVIDDLEDREEAESDTQRRKTKRYVYRDVLPMFNMKGFERSRLKIIGTPVHAQALLPELYKSKKKWKKAWFGIYKDDGTPAWPSYLGREEIENLRKELEDDPGAFASEYLCKPITSENPIFVKEWIKEYDEADDDFNRKLNQEGLYTIIAIDPAISRRQRADYSALVTISASKYKPEKYYVRTHGVTRHRGTVEKTIDEAARLYEQFSATGVVIETVAFQQAVADEWTKYCEDHHWHANRIEIKHGLK